MKFLCVPCDKPMQLEGKGNDRGSISLTYSCEDCGYEGRGDLGGQLDDDDKRALNLSQPNV